VLNARPVQNELSEDRNEHGDEGTEKDDEHEAEHPGRIWPMDVRIILFISGLSTRSVRRMTMMRRM
jgi:hypothetical protein